MRFTLNLLRKSSLLTLVAFVLLHNLNSCKTPDTKGIITVLDIQTENPVTGATVRLYMEEAGRGFFICGDGRDPILERQYTTDSRGRVEICFKYPSVVNVEVTHPSGRTGFGRLSLQEAETTNLRVFIGDGIGVTDGR